MDRRSCRTLPAWVDARRALVEVWLLSPLWVLPVAGPGIGARLLAAAIEAAQTPGGVAVPRGQPRYYGARGFGRASPHGFTPASARTPDAAFQVVRYVAHEDWIAGRLIYPDVWWRHDVAGLRDPLLAESRRGTEMKSETRDYRTGDHDVVLDLTATAVFVDGEGDGLLHLFVPHATAGLAVIETGAGSDDDLLVALGDLLPADDRWRHGHGTPGHGRSHVMPAFVTPYATVRCSAEGSRWAPGRASAWSTSTSTTPTGRSGSPSSPDDPVILGADVGVVALIAVSSSSGPPSRVWSGSAWV